MTWDNLGNAASRPTTRGRRTLDPASVAIIGVSRTAAVGTHTRLDRFSLLDRYVKLINATTLLRAFALQLTGQPPAVAPDVGSQLSSMSAVFIVGLAAPTAADVQDRVSRAGGPLIVAYTDAIATAQAAAVLAVLKSLDVPTHRARVALADAGPSPRLRSILVGAGIPELTRWHECDASSYSRRRLRAHHDVVISPNPTTPLLAFGEHTVRLPEPADLAALVVPGLLSALCGHRIAASGIEYLIAAAHGIAAVTPTGQTLPAVDEPLLIGAIARHIDHLITRPHR